MEEGFLGKSQEEISISPPTAPLGRAMNTLLGARPRHLEAAISRLGPAPSRSTSGSLLEESLCFLWRHVEGAVKRGEELDDVLIPIIEHSLKTKGAKHHKEGLILIFWLFEDEVILPALSSNLTEIIMRKEDHYIAFGWCTFVGSLVELIMSLLSDKRKQEQHITLLKILCQSVSHLLSIICRGSTLVEGFELPTRLSVAAADCILIFTEALTKKAPLSEAESSRKQSTVLKPRNRLVTHVPFPGSGEDCNIAHKLPKDLEDMEMELLLLHHLGDLVILVERLQVWSRKSRPLHAKGLEQVLKWLQEMKQHYVSPQDEAGGKLLRNGVLLFSSCWKHYGMLLRLEDKRFVQHHSDMLDQYLSAIQFCMQNETDDLGKLTSNIETRKFFLNCVALLWGKLHGKQLENAVSESGPQLLNLLFSQLKCDDEVLIEETVNILRAIIFKSGLSSGSSSLDTSQMGAILPLLLNLLDERDSTARAVVFLTAEYCYLNSDGQGLQEILKRLDSGTNCQKRNAIDVILELVTMSLDSISKLPLLLRRDVARCLLECLGHEELLNHVEASTLFPRLDPPFVLPALVQLVYSDDEKVSLSASNTLVSVLKCHSQDFNVIELLLDTLSNLSQTQDFPKKPVETVKSIRGSLPSHAGSKLDVDKVLGLTPKWSGSVHDWSLLAEKLIDKMFLNPSNAVIVRFMSSIGKQLEGTGDLVLHRVLLFMQGQKDMDEGWLSDRRCGALTSEDAIELSDSLFPRLCPLLILRLLPLRVFDNLESQALYGVLVHQETFKADRGVCDNNRDSVAAFLINRALGLFEYEDVRKLAAELCGRLHPQVLLPVMGHQLDKAAKCQDILKLKACLFAVCTSLVARGSETASHPVMARIRKVLYAVLSWASVDADEVSKAQHGCIDCIAMMICAEVQAPESSKCSSRNRVNTVGEANNCPEAGALASSVLAYVIQRLTSDEEFYTTTCSDDSPSDGKSDDVLPSVGGQSSNFAIPLTFRLCMANVLISACQKVSNSSKSLFASKIFPVLIHSIETIGYSEIRAACLQVLFSAVYHLKSSILPFSPDLLKLSIKALRKGSAKEKIAAVKLMASLMASEHEIVENISFGLLEAKSVLARVSSSDSSFELRQLCEKLLACVSLPVDDVFRAL